jgi:signal peptidase I
LEPAAVKQKDLLTDVLESFVIAMAISVLVYFTIAVPNQVEGESMEPNFYNNELLLTNKVIQWLGPTDLGKSMNLDYERGDVVILDTNGVDLIKRVVAKGGDVIRLHDGNVYVNGKLLEEEYLPAGLKTYAYSGPLSFIQDDEEKTVPAGSYFVMGDNRGNSKDSRFTDVGFIARSQLKGKVFLRYWPLNRISVIGRGQYLEKSQ